MRENTAPLSTSPQLPPWELAGPPQITCISCFHLKDGDDNAHWAAFKQLLASVTHLLPRRGAGGMDPSEAIL